MKRGKYTDCKTSACAHCSVFSIALHVSSVSETPQPNDSVDIPERKSVGFGGALSVLTMCCWSLADVFMSPLSAGEEQNKEALQDVEDEAQ